MFSPRGLISLDGFDYLLQQAQEPRNSQRNLTTLLDSLYCDFQSPQETYQCGKSRRQIARSVRKNAQYWGILAVLRGLGTPSKILEVGCGNGDLSRFLSLSLDASVLGIDSNADLIRKQKAEGELRFQYVDLTKEQIEGEFDAVIGLHCCGNLSDKVIDTAINNSASLVCVPCCYGKIQDSLPRSKTLSERKIEMKYALKRASYLEGYVDKKGSRASILLEIYRRLIDFDRIFVLKEAGYDAGFARITGEGIQSHGKLYSASPLRSAIVARKSNMCFAE